MNNCSRARDLPAESNKSGSPDVGISRDAIRNPKIQIIRQSIRSERIMDASGWIKDIRFNSKQHPMIVERCTIAHSNRRNETI
ncbi:hypothetical protein GLOIN_2v1882276 [Rhizophagus irregularis DAOM 181602=DAOM 197198]|nr:hypothetical protein GLOIN_2v1882276 [Rhizophagus irregularis DAOM 181602=DAOM 197198]